MNLIHLQHPPRGPTRDVDAGGSISERRKGQFLGGAITTARSPAAPPPFSAGGVLVGAIDCAVDAVPLVIDVRLKSGE
jgi:hypothetical protein